LARAALPEELYWGDTAHAVGRKEGIAAESTRKALPQQANWYSKAAVPDGDKKGRAGSRPAATLHPLAASGAADMTGAVPGKRMRVLGGAAGGTAAGDHRTSGLCPRAPGSAPDKEPPDGFENAMTVLRAIAAFRHQAAEAPQTAQGQEFFTNKHGHDGACASCHTAKPTVDGKHASTGKPIRPLAPAANPERFVDPAKTEKWFRRNCNDVVGRECSVAEKADVLAWLITLKP
jgi:hypothetical protein